MAVGFTKGTLLKDPTDTPTHRYSVTTSDAHAWPEAWFAGTGWVRFEPTPSVSGATVPDYSVPAAVTSRGQDPSTATASPTATLAGRPERPAPRDLLRNDGDAATNPLTKKSPSSMSPWLFAPVAVAVLSVVPLLLTLVRRHRRWRHPDALTAWSQLVDDARDVGHHWHRPDSPRAAAARLAESHRLPSPALEALGRLAVAAERARYAPPGRQAGVDLTTWRGDVGTIRSALQTTSPTRVRLRAQLFAPSTLQWAARGVGEQVANALDSVDDLIAAVTRPIRRRATTR